MPQLPRYVMGIDPGYLSGISMYDLLAEKQFGCEVPFNEYGATVEELVRCYRPYTAAEAFVINMNTARNTQAPWSLEGIGIARYAAQKYGCPFIIQAQSNAVNMTPDSLLKRLGWYVPGQRNLKRAQAQVVLLLISSGWWHELLDDDLPNIVVPSG